MPNRNGHGPKRAILYARVSTDEQARSGYSLARQLEALRDYAAREGYQVLEEVTGPGQCGASLERPAMDPLRDRVAGGRVALWCWPSTGMASPASRRANTTGQRKRGRCVGPYLQASEALRSPAEGT